MRRDEFVFTIGYQADAAIVDRAAMKKHANLGTMELLDLGLYRAAFCSALYSENDDEMKEFLHVFAEKTGIKADTADDLKRLFGVYPTAGVNKTLLI